MADKVQRAELPAVDEFMDAPHHAHGIATEVIESFETELRDLKSLHADIIDQGRKVQIAASGESEYGAMSKSRYIDWVAEMLEGKC